MTWRLVIVLVVTAITGCDADLGPGGGARDAQARDGAATADSPSVITLPDGRVVEIDSGGVVVDPDSLRAHTGPDLEIAGSAVDATALRTEAMYAETLGREHNGVTPENAMKWGPVHPEAARWDYADADAIVDFAAAHGQEVRGHALVWHLQLPTWVNESLGADGLRAAMVDHVTTLVTHYRDRVRVWDVVNEAIDDQGGLRDSVFSRLLGRGFVAEAFRAARAADPSAVLAYNDYGIEAPGPKLDAVLTLIRELVAEGAPIDAVGMQFHVSAYSFASGRLDEGRIRAAMRQIGDLGLAVYVTELDVRVRDLSGPAAGRLDYQRLVYQVIAGACRAEPACRGVTTWGFTDAHSWVDDFYGPDDPLPFDDAYARKPAYFGLRDGIDGAAAASLDPGYDTACGHTLTGTTLCDPMESDTLAPWYRATVNGAVESQGARVYRGALAMHASTTTSAASQALVGEALFSAHRSGTIYARAYVYLPSSVPVSGLTLLALGEAAPPYAGVSVNVSATGRVQLSATTAALYPEAPIAFPRDRWTCVTLRVDVGEPGGAAQIGIDGATAIARSGFDTLPAGGYGNVNFGIVWAAPAAAPAEAFFDEVAVSEAPLACD